MEAKHNKEKITKLSIFGGYPCRAISTMGCIEKTFRCVWKDNLVMMRRREKEPGSRETGGGPAEKNTEQAEKKR